MTDEELIERLLGGCSCNIDTSPCMAEDDCRLDMEAARRICSLLEQLEAARRDAKEAEACLEERWQPIETAPRDGTSILVFTELGVFEASFDSHWEFAVADYHGCLCCSGGGDNPTHWMPLPEPPKESP